MEQLCHVQGSTIEAQNVANCRMWLGMWKLANWF